MTAAYAFCKLVVADLARAEAFYERVFGMRVRRRHTSDEHAFGQEESVLSVVNDTQGPVLILTRYLHRPLPPSGCAWSGFVVTDLDQAVAAVEQAGGTIEVPAHVSRSHPVRAAIANDPDGHLIEIVEIASSHE